MEHMGREENIQHRSRDYITQEYGAGYTRIS